MSIVRCSTRDASLIVGSNQVYSRSDKIEDVCSGCGFCHGCYGDFSGHALIQ